MNDPLHTIASLSHQESSIQDSRSEPYKLSSPGADGSTELLASNITIRRRGQSSLTADKAQYSIDITGFYGEAEEASILGLHKDEKWALYSSSADTSLLRDRLGADLGRALGRWAPHMIYVELFLLRADSLDAAAPLAGMYPHHYQGVYQIEERISRGKHRVDVEKPYTKPKNISSEAHDKSTRKDKDKDEEDEVHMGGYIFAVDKTPSRIKTEIRVTSSQGMSYAIKYPSAASITLEEIEWLRGHLSTVEGVLASPNFTDADTGYRRHLDVASFVDMFLLNEFSRNVDAYRMSSYYSLRDRDERIVAGPVWDMDRGWAGYLTDMRAIGTEGWLLYSHIGDTPLWWERMLEDPSYVQQVIERYFELRNSTFSDESLNAQLAGYVEVLDVGGAAVREWMQWGVGVNLFGRKFAYTSPDTHAQRIMEYARARLAWMDAHVRDLPA